MIDINLAPGAEPRRAPRRKASSPKLSGLPKVRLNVGGLGSKGGAAAVLLLGVLLLWFQGTRHASLETRIEQAVTDSTRNAATIALIEQLQARQDTIRQQINVIREVDQRRYVWPHLLDEISRAVPAFTWMRQISSVEATDSLGNGPSFTLQGNAGSTQALTRFMKGLEGSPFIRDVTLVTSEQQDLEGRPLHRFTLEARYETPDRSVIETVPVVIVE